MVGKVKKTSCPELKTDIVYLYQAPRSGWTPSVSPDCLKLETWLRMKEIPYEHVDIETLAVSPISQLPQIKYNGKDIPYTHQLTNELAKMFNKEEIISEGGVTNIETTLPLDNGAQRAFEVMIEEHLSWVLIYMRATQANQLPSNDVFQGRLWKILSPLANKVVTNKLKTKADYQGIGRQNASDVWATGKEDLWAISAYLGSKDYLAGEQPNKLDATAFAYLCQFYYAPSDNELKTFIKEQCPLLVTYIERMKNRFWSDWEEKLRKPTPPKEKSRKTKDEQQVAVVNTTTEQDTTNIENGNENKEGVVVEPTVVVNGSSDTTTNTPVVEKVKIESTVEIVSTAPIVEDKIVQILENGINEEHKHVLVAPNGGTIGEVAQ